MNIFLAFVSYVLALVLIVAVAFAVTVIWIMSAVFFLLLMVAGFILRYWFVIAITLIVVWLLR